MLTFLGGAAFTLGAVPLAENAAHDPACAAAQAFHAGHAKALDGGASFSATS